MTRQTVRMRIGALARAPFAAATWRAVLFTLAGLPPAAVGFGYAVASTVLGAGLSVTFIGLPLVAVGGLGAVGLADLNRVLAARILGRPVPGAAFRRARPGFFGWLQARLLEPRAWRARLYLVLKLPLAVVTGYAVAMGLAEGLAALLYPLLWRLSGPFLPSYILRTTGHRGRPTLWIGRIPLDTWPRTLPVCLLGGLTLILAAWLVRGLVLVDVALMRGLLGPTAGTRRVQRLETARGVVAEDSAATLRRIERDLHDGTQAQIVALAMNLGAVRRRLRAAPEAERDAATLDLVDTAHRHAKEALTELRTIVAGIHPPALDLGLDNALATLAARSAVPAEFSAELATRPSPAIETIAYYSVAELLTNVAKHSRATRARVDVRELGRRLVLTVTDDGHGGADPATGTGLAGLAGRLDAVDGSLDVSSPPGGPTVVTIDLPLRI